MKLAVIAFTKWGIELCEKLSQQLTDCTGFYLSSYHHSEELHAVNSLGAWTEVAIAQYEGIIFIGACGIAVRAIAPFIQNKVNDPAVISLDDEGRFIISLLSGHLGGANELAQEIADLTKGTAVISTATDNHHVWAIDQWAKKNQCMISDYSIAKKISAALLAGREIGITTIFKRQKLSVPNIFWAESGPLGMVIDLNTQKYPFAETVHLLPKIVTVGIGCRKGSSLEVLETVLEETLQTYGVDRRCLAQIASIDLKQEEEGLLALSAKYKLPFVVFSADQLKQAVYQKVDLGLSRTGENFSQSDFVQQVTGVDNVCERAALLASQGALILSKQIKNGVTIALAVKNWTVVLE